MPRLLRENFRLKKTAAEEEGSRRDYESLKLLYSLVG